MIGNQYLSIYIIILLSEVNMRSTYEVSKTLLLLEVTVISIYKLGDVGISSNLIGSLSLTNGHCPPPGRWIMKQWPAGVTPVLPK